METQAGQVYAPELKLPGISLGFSLLVHGLLLGLLFWSAVRERAQQNTWHNVEAPVFSVLLTPASTAAVEAPPPEVVVPPTLPVVEKAEISLARAKPDPVPPEKLTEAKPVKLTSQRTKTERPVRKQTASDSAVKTSADNTRDNTTQQVNRAGNAQVASPDAGPRGNAPQRMSGEVSDGEKQAYLAKVRMAVEKNKTYPSRTRRMKIQGSVQVEIMIDATGNITAARLIKSSGEASLDEAAVDAARKARSSGPPPVSLGRTIVMQIDFQLNKR